MIIVFALTGEFNSPITKSSLSFPCTPPGLIGSPLCKLSSYSFLRPISALGSLSHMVADLLSGSSSSPPFIAALSSLARSAAYSLLSAILSSSSYLIYSLNSLSTLMTILEVCPPPLIFSFILRNSYVVNPLCLSSI